MLSHFLKFKMNSRQCSMRILRVFHSAEQRPRKMILTTIIKKYGGREGTRQMGTTT